MSNLETDPTVYSLVFEGLVEESPEVLQRLKGIFIADLDLSIPEVQSILEKGTGIVCTDSVEEEINRKFKLLLAAGAQVHIVGPAEDQGTNFSISDDDDAIEWSEEESFDSRDEENSAAGFSLNDEVQADEDLEAQNDLEEEFEDEEGDEDFELEFSLDDMLEEKPRPKKARRSTVHVLDIDDDSNSLDDTLSELGIEPGEAILGAPEGTATEIPADIIAASETELEFRSDEVDLSFADESKPEGQVNFSAPSITSESDDSLFGEAVNPDTGFLQSATSDSKKGPRVNASGVIPESEIADLPLFELASMDEEVSKAVTKTAPLESVEKTEESRSALFEDLTLQPEIESAVIDPLENTNTVHEDLDLTIPSDPDDEQESDLEFAADMEPLSSKLPETGTKGKGAAEGLFGGVELDSILDSVSSVASGDLAKAGIEIELEDSTTAAPQSPIKRETVTTEARRESEVAIEPEPEREVKQTVRKKQPSSEPKAVPLGQVKTVKAKPQPAQDEADGGVVEEEFEVDAPVVRRRSGLPVDVIVGILLGVSVLGAGNWFYFSQSKEENELEQSRIQAALQKSQKEAQARLDEMADAARLAAEEGKIKYTNKYVGQFKENGILANATAVVADRNIEIAAFSLRGPKPAELTDQEIIDEVSPRPWLAKVAIDAETVTLDEKDTFTKSVPVKVFVTHKNHSERYPAEGRLSGRLNAQKHTLELTLQLAQGLTPITKDMSQRIEAKGEGKFVYAIRGSVTMQATIEKPEEK